MLTVCSPFPLKVTLGLLAALVTLTSAGAAAVAAAGTLSFAPAVNYGAHTRPVSVAVGDLNGDGKPDLAVANYDSADVSVLLGNGDGSFQAAVNYGAHSHPTSVAPGDLNRDGRLDLVVANNGSSDLSVLLGNGDGSFQPAVNYGVLAPYSVAIADLNGDGKPDLAVATSCGTTSCNHISILLGNGDGSFQPAVNYATGDQSLSVAVGDLNGDGKPDLAIATGRSGVAVLLGNGDGSFRPAVNYGTHTTPNTSVAIADLNGDGKPDLAVTDTDIDDDVSVLLGNGDGSFQPAVNYLVGRFPHSVAVGDLNGDGKLDLAVQASGCTIVLCYSVSVLLGNGDGSFQAPVYFAAHDSPATAVGSGRVAIADLNGDGKPDLAVANGGSNDVSVLLNTTAPTTHTLTVTKAGSGSGSVTSAPAGIDCGATCSAQFAHGTTATLTATAAAGSSFTGWGGACSGTGTCTVTIDQDRAVTATFAVQRANQTITFGPLANKRYGDPDFAVSASASSGLPVSFAASGNCTVSGATVHLTSAGSCTITASQSGNANYNPATPVSQSFLIASRLLPPTRCKVPNVVGMLLRKAVVRIAHAHCRPGRIIRVVSTKAKKNHVLAQNPKPGKTLKQGAKVNLTVGKGPTRK